MNAVNTDQQTALHLASLYGSPAVVRILLAQPGVDCNPRGMDGYTPLMLAVLEDGKAECVRGMVGDRRGELDTGDHGGTTVDDAAG